MLYVSHIQDIIIFITPEEGLGRCEDIIITIDIEYRRYNIAASSWLEEILDFFF